MGSLYSRSIGVLISKGEYIFPLDNDDLFFYEGIFDYILKIAKDFNFNIVGFRAFMIGNYSDSIQKMTDLYPYQYYDKNITIYQPSLSTWMINRKGHYSLHDVTIWAKCIKSTIYKEATKKLGKKNYSNFVSWAEDTIINFIIFNIAESFIFIHKYGIIHFHNRVTASYSMPNEIKLFGEIFLTNIIYDFSKNNNDKNYAVLSALSIQRRYKIYVFHNNSKYLWKKCNLIFFKSILNKLIKSHYISNEMKNKIKIHFQKFLNTL